MRYPFLMIIPNLRSPREKTHGIVYFARMIDKIRLHSEGKLPPDYVPNLGEGFDERCVNLLHVSYNDLKARVAAGGSEVELLEWAFEHGRKPSEEEIEIWNDFMRKRGWNDDVSDRLEQRIKDGHFEDRNLQTMFDYIDADEGR